MMIICHDEIPENKCCECSGKGEDLIKYDDGYYYCPECLATMLSEKSTSVVDAFLTEHFSEFVEFVAFVC
ncbi:MAG: hypothetical protein U0K91_11120 [Acutalibacteraceae bacterium]|nr:hypothetical protein [Acutalibacteraceae bacterium]